MIKQKKRLSFIMVALLIYFIVAISVFPLFEDEPRGCSLWNLFLSFITLCLALILYKKSSYEKKSYRKDFYCMASAWIAILSIGLFCFTQDVTEQLIFIDQWTLFMLLLYMLQLVLFYHCRTINIEVNKTFEIESE